MENSTRPFRYTRVDLNPNKKRHELFKKPVQRPPREISNSGEVNNWAIQTETSFCVVLCGKSSSTRLVCFSFGILQTSPIPSITPLSHLLYGQRALCVRREHHRPLAKATSKDDRFGPHNRYRIVRRTHYPVPCLLLAVRFYVSRIHYFWFFQHDLWISIYVRHPENV